MAGTYQAGDRTKSEILEGSKKLFYKKGYTDTTYNDISELLGINRALIPYHFKSKQTLALTVYNEIIDHVAARADELLDTASMSDDLSAAFHLIIFYRLFVSKQFTNLVCQLLKENSELLIDSDAEKAFLIKLSDSYSNKSIENDLSISSMNNIRFSLIKMIKDNNYSSENAANKKSNLSSSDIYAKTYINYALRYVGTADDTINELFNAAVQLANLIDVEIRPDFKVIVSYK
ncbi:MAG: TetR/AcrR family transcriptional regulator [Lachnospiraceae bacterium]|nr:TetR/AcrR family transcriptional regulator [Lachnospiraceae bacterium]